MQPGSSSQKGSFSLKRYGLSKADRLRTSSEYRTLSKSGNRQYCGCFIIVSRNNGASRSRIGITVSKKVGKAVERNKIKRIVRDYFRLNRDLLHVHMDITIIARHMAGGLEAAVIRKHLGRCFKKISGNEH